MKRFLSSDSVLILCLTFLLAFHWWIDHLERSSEAVRQLEACQAAQEGGP